MSHLHFPDGLLPLWLIVAGFALTALILSLSLKRLKAEENFVRKVSLLAILSALMLVAMSIPLGFIHYHVNLAVLVSLLLGPWLSFIGVFVVNFFLGFIGHGGLTVVGLNTLVVGSEVFLAHCIFYGLRHFLKTVPAVLCTTVLTLFLSSLLMISLVATAGLSPSLLGDSHHHEHGHNHDDGHHQEDHQEHGHNDGHHQEDHQTLASSPQTRNGSGFLSYMEAFFKYILPFLLAGALIEAAVTGGIVKYLRKVKPDLVEHLYREKEPQEKVEVS